MPCTGMSICAFMPVLKSSGMGMGCFTLAGRRFHLFIAVANRTSLRMVYGRKETAGL